MGREVRTSSNWRAAKLLTDAVLKIIPSTTAAAAAGEVRCDSAASNILKYHNGSAEISVASVDGTETMTNKTLTSPALTSPTMAVSSGVMKNHAGFRPSTLTAGTSTTPSTTTVYLSQVMIPANCTLTGIKVNNGATVGTDKYIVALFNSSGTAVANSALAGTTTAGADAYQAVPFTSTYAASGPAVYWLALYVNGTTDRFRSIPAAGEAAGYAGSVTGQTFGTVAAITPPTTFTADKGPVAFTY